MSEYQPWSVFYLDWPSPLQEKGIVFDPFAAATPAGEGEAEISLASGKAVKARFTVPLEGVLRVRVAESLGPPVDGPLVAGRLENRPAVVGSGGDGSLAIEGSGVGARWLSEGGLSFERFRPVAGSSKATVTGASGRVLAEGGGPVGWMQMVALDPDARIYGGGESFQGPNLRGRLRRIVNVETHTFAGLDSAYINVPFFWSDAGWGVFFNTPAPSRADLAFTHSEIAAVAVEGAELDMFVFVGDPGTILRRYQEITGMPGTFPEWALGVWMSRCSYMSAADIEQTLDELNEAGCPVDVVHVDAWVSGNVIRDLACNWSIDRARFPEGWVKRLSDRGVKVSLWHNPYVIQGTELARELDGRGLLVRMPDGTLAVTNDNPDRNLIDFTNPDAVAWWKEQVSRVAREEGNVSFKPDFAEEVPEGAVFHDGRRGRELRNEYALLYQRATHEALSELTDDGKVALFCRSGTAGSQRYPCHWVGDTPSTWTGMVTALRACLSLSLSGFGIVGQDVGGFYRPDRYDFDEFRDAFESMDPSIFEAEVDPELYARWAQWGAFTPVMRFHGTGKREPSAYPEPARSVAIEACRIRESMRGYLSAAAEIAAREGTPMMRPMALAYPHDLTARSADHQYLLGPDILVAPVLAPGGVRTLFVPEGHWAGLVGLGDLEGPGWITVECGLAEFPAFVREGAHWPMEG
ncbi:MAG: glycoside hydrolase family 31 protein [Actinomycetota bacterium]